MVIFLILFLLNLFPAEFNQPASQIATGPMVTCYYDSERLDGGGMYRCGDCAWLTNRVPQSWELNGRCEYPTE